MGAPAIVYLPGLFGSTLGWGTSLFFAPTTIWVSPFSAFSSILLQLQLAVDGRAPGPLTSGIAVTPTGLIQPFYGAMARYLERRGYRVERTAYDWRLTVADAAASVVNRILDRLPNTPIVFVGHSLGGLVARAAAASLAYGGKGSQVLGIITYGTPHYGSLVPVQTWFGLAAFYQRLDQVLGLISPSANPNRNPLLDVICSTWPSLFELMSFKASGPLAQFNPVAASAIYEIANYAGGNPTLAAPSFAAAIAAQAVLSGQLDTAKMRCIVGSGVETPVDLDLTYPLSSPKAYLLSDVGDGVVDVDSAVPRGVEFLTVRGISHELLPQAWPVWHAVEFFLGQILGPGA